jgi:hypothetical protein
LLIRVRAVKQTNKIKPIDRDVITIDRKRQKDQVTDERALTREKRNQKELRMLFYLAQPAASAANLCVRG